MSTLSIYNSHSKKIERFVPQKPGHVSLYVCGITVYDMPHLGHARTYLFFDVLHRLMIALGYQVQYIRNITDVDDKIIKRSEETGRHWLKVVAENIKVMHADFQRLQMLPPTTEPRASEHIEEMITLIEQLIEAEFAYVAASGSVYFARDRFPEYGQLVGLQAEELLQSVRITNEEEKRQPGDFVLWKRDDGTVSWPSPWGQGRPGWHIECSAMAMKYAGTTLDIHGGGLDLKFPHHENEIAQSQAHTGCPLANYWMHAGHLSINDVKMSKSLGNFYTVDEVLTHFHPEVLRFYFIQGHYRSPMNFTQQHLIEAENALLKIYRLLDHWPQQVWPEMEWSALPEDFQQAMLADLNTPLALAAIHRYVRLANEHWQQGDQEQACQYAGQVVAMGHLLGLFYSDFATVSQQQSSLSEEKIEAMVQARDAARANKDWQESDRIRDKLASYGVQCEDGPNGTQWYWKRLKTLED